MVSDDRELPCRQASALTKFITRNHCVGSGCLMQCLENHLNQLSRPPFLGGMWCRGYEHQLVTGLPQNENGEQSYAWF